MSSQFANYFKNDEYEALFHFAYAPCDFVHPEYFNFNDFKNEMIINVCNDVIQDFNNHGDMYEDSYINLRFSRRPRISFQECFKSDAYMIVFFLLVYKKFLNEPHGCGNYEEEILKITEDIEDITDRSIKWKKMMFNFIDNLPDIPIRHKELAKMHVIELWSKMNILDAPGEELKDLEELGYIY